MPDDDQQQQQVERIKVWPADGVLVRDENTLQPIVAGQEVTLTRSIERALASGDLLRQAPDAPEQPRATTDDQPADDQRERAVVSGERKER